NPDYREEYFDATPLPDDEYNQAILAANKGKRLPMVGRVEVYVVEEQQPRYLAFLNSEFDFLERLPAEFANVASPGNQLAGDLKRKLASDPWVPLTIEFASTPVAQQKPLDENWKKNMDAIGIHLEFKKAMWPDLLKESKAGKLQMWGVGWLAAVPDADIFFGLLYGPNAGQANHSRFNVPEFNRLYQQAKRLPDGPERNA